MALPNVFPLQGIPREGAHFPDLTPHVQQTDAPVAYEGYFDVFPSKDIRNQKLNIVKVIRNPQRNDSSLNADLQKSFVRIGTLWGKLKHPNLARLLGVTYGINDCPGLIIEGTDCVTLASSLPSHTHTEQQKLTWVKQIASGLRFLHSRSSPIIHGELTGDNIVVKGSGDCSITNIGVAQFLEDHPAFRNTFGGTVYMRYAPPEAFSLDLPSQQAFTLERDIFAFAMTLILIFSGQHPFGDIGHIGFVGLVLRGERPSLPTQLQADILLRGIVQGCWTQKASDRLRISEVCHKLGLRSAA